MTVKRIVANIESSQPKKAIKFYGDILGMAIGMDMGWIVTFVSEARSIAQISFAKEGGSGTPVPDLSIEVDNLDEVYQGMVKAKFKIEYPLTLEPWGVQRFFVRDPFGRLVNILSHHA